MEKSGSQPRRSQIFLHYMSWVRGGNVTIKNRYFFITSVGYEAMGLLKKRTLSPLLVRSTFSYEIILK
jgi:hypothetical protein